MAKLKNFSNFDVKITQMEIYYTIKDLQNALNKYSSQKQSIGFVPTMGALHEGHLSLIRCSKQRDDIIVVSIFVNPTQFNDPKDLERYPRMLDEDIRKLQTVDCDILFAPSEQEMYPEPDTRVFDFGYLDKVYEGKYRPGHFNGVAQIVSKLFDIVKPNRAYFGQKDYQQLLIVKELVRKYMPNSGIEIISCPIIREADGLAMSSRNMLLDPQQRKSAAKISQVLFKAKEMAKAKSPHQIKQMAIEALNADKYLRVEYFDIVDAQTLKPIEDFEQAKKIIAITAVYCGNVRLIDNLFLKE